MPGKKQRQAATRVPTPQAVNIHLIKTANPIECLRLGPKHTGIGMGII